MKRAVSATYEQVRKTLLQGERHLYLGPHLKLARVASKSRGNGFLVIQKGPVTGGLEDLCSHHINACPVHDVLGRALGEGQSWRRVRLD